MGRSRSTTSLTCCRHPPEQWLSAALSACATTALRACACAPRVLCVWASGGGGEMGVWGGGVGGLGRGS
jgi:hypothetical protein